MFTTTQLAHDFSLMFGKEWGKMDIEGFCWKFQIPFETIHDENGIWVDEAMNFENATKLHDLLEKKLND